MGFTGRGKMPIVTVNRRNAIKITVILVFNGYMINLNINFSELNYIAPSITVCS